MVFYSTEQLGRVRRIIGLTFSREGEAIEAAAVEIGGSGDEVRCTVSAFTVTQLDQAMRSAALDARRPGGVGPSALAVLHAALGLALVDAAVQARSTAGWKRREVDAIGIDGFTVWRQSDPVELAGAFVAGTIQLGDAATVAEALGAPVVSDFRSGDLAAGGRGEPIDALVDRLMPKIAGHGDQEWRAMTFAVLADRTMQGLPGNLPEVTGASHAVVLGSITPGR